MADAGRAAILLAVRDGAPWLPAQLQSIAAQDFERWDLIAGDDASRDASLRLLRGFAAAAQGHRVEIVDGPRAGGTAHFLTLLARAGAGPRWIAFADQDDVWLPGKLGRAVAALEAAEDGTPSLYCSRTWVTGPDLEAPAISRPWRRPFGFLNALVQNIASGNTIVLNRAAADLAQRAVPASLGVPAHDWWLYQLVTGAGGRILHDDRPSLYYRQHGANQVGANRGLAAAWARAQKILAGGYSDWNAANLAALDAVRGDLTPENRAHLDAFARMRTERFPRRLAAFARLGVYRQTPVTQAVLWLAAALGRI